MTEFNIKLAEIPICVQANNSYTKSFCKDYLTDDTPKITVKVSLDDIEKERELSRLQNIRENIPVIDYSDEYLETTALYRKIVNELIYYDVLLFHGSVVAVDGKAYIFIAKSGTGKTTHTSLWLENISGSYILNGDKPLLCFKNNKVYACGTPWQGKENYGVNEILPLCGVCILERAENNAIEKITYNDAFKSLVSHSYNRRGVEYTSRALSLISKLSAVNMYRLGCNMEDEAAILAYNTMRKDD